MEAVLKSLMAGFPVLMAHSAVTLVILALGTAIHIQVTPYHEFKQMREGNAAVAVALGGAILGMAIPLAFTLAGSVGVWDIVVWGIVVVVLQLIAYQIAALMLRDLGQRIERGEVGAAIFLVSVKLAVAAINAAAVAG